MTLYKADIRYFRTFSDEQLQKTLKSLERNTPQRKAIIQVMAERVAADYLKLINH